MTSFARIGTSVLALSSVALGGCSVTKLAIGTQAEVMVMASPVIEEQTDYEYARAGIPASLVQTEGLLRITPEDEHLLLLGARGFASYAYGFIEEEKELAELKGDLDGADYHRARARAMYLKSRDFGIRLLEQDAPTLKDHLKRDPEKLKRFLTEEFTDKEDAPALFWTGYAWGSAIGVARDDLTLVADLPLAQTLVERSVELDETFYNAAGHTFLGVVNSSRGQAVGGDPAKGKQHFERALALTKRKALLPIVNYAGYYAVQEQNRPLFDALIKEVLEAPAPTPAPLALPNTIAKRRAQRLQSQADSLILPPLPETPPEPPASAPAASTPPAAPAPA
ncbi:MAG TPA: TRAP transporter TatT component family protein, partial [Polyangiaceae bacterium]